MRLVLLAILSSAAAAAPAEPAGIDSILRAVRAEPKDLARPVGLVDEPHRPPFVLELLEDPLSSLPRSEETAKRVLAAAPASAAQILADRAGLNIPPHTAAFATHWEGTVPEAARDILGPLLGEIIEARKVLGKRAPAGLIAEFRSQLTNRLPDPARLGPGESWFEKDAEVLEQIGSSEIERRVAAGIRVLEAIEGALPRLRETSPGDWAGSTIAVSGLKVVLGSPGADIYEEEADLIIDPGGDDLYRGKALAARPGAVSVIIDLGGNDRYLGGGFGSIAAGIDGISIVVDAAGSDAYLASDASQGAGLYGFGALWDLAGNDLYQARSFSQGAGSLGVGLLIDESGTDLYRASYMSQGLGHVRGGGLLRDAAGNDLYASGYSEPDPRGYTEKYGSSAQGEVFQSLSQGFGMGWRDHAGGGAGLLVDGRGNDRYIGDYFAQGSAYWFSWGMLYDGAGNDSYISRRYSQGAGVHFAVGTLLDASGNDRYQTWAVGLGCGHDYGVGLLWDGAGDDSYTGDWTVLGMSNAQGIGILRDQGGSDRYSFSEGAGAGSYWDELRHGAGIGLFMDSGEREDFFSVKRDTRAWSQSPWSAALSGRRAVAWGLPPESSVEPAGSGSVYRDADEEEARFLAARLARAERLGEKSLVTELLAVGAGWGVNSSVPAEAKRLLLSLNPAAAWPHLSELLGQSNVFVVMILEEYLHGLAGSEELLEGFLTGASADEKTRARAAYFLGKLRRGGSIPVLAAALKDASARVRAAAARGLGYPYDRDLRGRVKLLREALAKKDEQAAVEILRQGKKSELLWLVSRIQGLSRGDWAAMSEGLERWAPPEGSARHAAVLLLRFPESLDDAFAAADASAEAAKTALGAALQDGDAEVRRWAVDSLEKCGGDPALLIRALDDGNYGVREAAAEALGRRGKDARETLEAALFLGTPARRALIMRALGRINDAGSAATLRGALDDPDSGVRREALRSLGLGRAAGWWTADPGRAAALAENDPDPWVRAAAGSLLGR